MVKKNLHVPIGGLDTEKDTVLLNGYYEGIFSRRLNGLSAPLQTMAQHINYVL